MLSTDLIKEHLLHVQQQFDKTRIMHPVIKTTRDVFPHRSMVVAIGVLVFLAVLLHIGNFTILVTTENTRIYISTPVPSVGNGEIVEGRVGNIAYYQCSATSVEEGPIKHLVLLHGSKFTKEDWKTSGILQSLCNVANLSVSAVDLPVAANHEVLIGLLDLMVAHGLVTLPISGLVTPSASGKSITDWIANGDLSQLPSYVELWIPVAAGSVATVSDDQWKSLEATVKDETKSFGIFAIYGNKDVGGERTSQTLRDHAGAATIELHGGHSCYLDSPDDFVTAVLSKLGLK